MFLLAFRKQIPARFYTLLFVRKQFRGRGIVHSQAIHPLLSMESLETTLSIYEIHVTGNGAGR